MSRPSPSFALDALRAGAAGLVLLSHARDMLIVDAASLHAPPLTVRLFMAVSGLGHQAVIVFFVLSGYLVTGGMLRGGAAGRWSLPVFALSRLTRLWMVLIPCLLLGGSLDALGLAWRGNVAAALPYGVPPLAGPAVAPTLSLTVALGNVVFLQTIAVPVFGSNGALWSLSNEAWYYALAGLAFAAWRSRSTPLRATPAALAATAITLALPRPMLALAPVWAFGAVAAMLSPVAPVQRRNLLPIVSALVAVLVASRLRLGSSPLGLDLLLGAAAALLIRQFATWQNPSRGPADATVRGLSRLSYSLYLSHTPVLAFWAAVVTGSSRLPPGPPAYGLMLSSMGLALVVAAGVWWSCERHTDRCRSALLRAWARLAQPRGIAVGRTVVPCEAGPVLVEGARP